MAKPSLPPFDQLDPTAEWAPWKPAPDRPWDARWAAHLYRRAAFGPTRDELKQAVGDGMDATVDKLLAAPKEPRRRPPAVSGPPPMNQATGMPDASGQAAVLRAAWLQRLIDGIEPAREKLTLFWHNHFATSIAKVNDSPLDVRPERPAPQARAGQVPPVAAARSAATRPCWSGSTPTSNVKGQPNENYAREVMELFTLGVGNYTEKDVREAARAFTGWHTDGDGKFTFVAGAARRRREDGPRQDRRLGRRRRGPDPARPARLRPSSSSASCTASSSARRPPAGRAPRAARRRASARATTTSPSWCGRSCGRGTSTRTTPTGSG